MQSSSSSSDFLCGLNNKKYHKVDRNRRSNASRKELYIGYFTYHKIWRYNPTSPSSPLGCQWRQPPAGKWWWCCSVHRPRCSQYSEQTCPSVDIYMRTVHQLSDCGELSNHHLYLSFPIPWFSCLFTN